MTKVRYHVVFIVPAAYSFAEGVREVAETIVYGLRQSGRHATLAVNGIDRDAVNIVLPGARVADRWA